MLFSDENTGTTRPMAAPPGDMSAMETVRSAINGLFAAGLDLCAARSMVDGEVADRIGEVADRIGEVADRIDQAIGEIDGAIASLRSRSFEFDVIDLTERQPADTGAGH